MTVGSSQPVSRAVAGSAAGSAGRAPRVDTGCLLLCSTATATPGGEPGGRPVRACGASGVLRVDRQATASPRSPTGPAERRGHRCVREASQRGAERMGAMSEPLPARRVPAVVDRPFTRRSLLVAALAGTALAVAGCTSSDGDDADAVTPEQVDQLAAQVQ